MLRNENELDLSVWHCPIDGLHFRSLNYFASQSLLCKIDVASQTMNNASQNAMRYRLICALSGATWFVIGSFCSCSLAAAAAPGLYYAFGTRYIRHNYHSARIIFSSLLNVIKRIVTDRCAKKKWLGND